MSHAFMLVQPSGDTSLMPAVLPKIEAEVRAKKGNAQEFALMFDRTRMRLGREQKYGTQLVGDLENNLYLFPIEQVEKRRKALGLFPLETYIDLIEKPLGRKVVR